MTTGSGIAVAGVWAAIALIVWITRKSMSPFGHFTIVVAATYATYYLAVGKP
jgi:hypothetical protein